LGNRYIPILLVGTKSRLPEVQPATRQPDQSMYHTPPIYLSKYYIEVFLILEGKFNCRYLI